MPLIFWWETKHRAPSYFLGLCLPRGAPFPLPTFSGSSQRLWEGCHLGGGFLTRKNSRVIHLPRRSSTSPTRCPGACVIPAGTVRGLSVATPWLPGSFINEVCLKGSYNLPVICCIFFFFPNLPGYWGECEGLDTNELALCPCLCFSFPTDLRIRGGMLDCE